MFISRGIWTVDHLQINMYSKTCLLSKQPAIKRPVLRFQIATNKCKFTCINQAPFLNKHISDIPCLIQVGLYLKKFDVYIFNEWK